MGQTESSRIADEKKFINALNAVRLTKEQIRVLYPELGNKRITPALQRYIEKKEAKKLLKLTKEVEDAKSLDEFKALVYRAIPREFKDPEHPSLELLINAGLFLGSMGISWASFLLFFPSGKDIIIKGLTTKKGAKEFTKVILRMAASGSTASDILSEVKIVHNLLGPEAPEWLGDLLTRAAIDKAIQHSDI